MTDDELAEKRALATAALHRAVELHAEAYFLDGDDEMLSEFLIVGAWVREDGGMTYTLGTSRGDDGMAEHVAIGMLQRALWRMQASATQSDTRG